MNRNSQSESFEWHNCKPTICICLFCDDAITIQIRDMLFNITWYSQVEYAHAKHVRILVQLGCAGYTYDCDSHQYQHIVLMLF
jgi:hypothetical protein